MISVFFSNDGVQKLYTQKKDTFLWTKKREQDIIVSKFLLFFGHLNLFSLSLEKIHKLIEKTGYTCIEII